MTTDTEETARRLINLSLKVYYGVKNQPYPFYALLPEEMKISLEGLEAEANELEMRLNLEGK